MLSNEEVMFYSCVFAVMRHDFRVLPAAQLVSAGDTTLLQCGPPRGRPEPTVFWRKDGRKVDPLADKR